MKRRYEDYNKQTQQSPLTEFAFLGLHFSKALHYLRRLAEPENWYMPSKRSEEDNQVGVLYYYLHSTFARAVQEEKVLIDTKCAICNTGLFDIYGEEIYMLFGVNSKKGQEGYQDWYLDSFYKESAHDIPEEVRGKLPSYVDYFSDNPQAMYYDTSLPLYFNSEHILADNLDRLPAEIKILPPDIRKSAIEGAKVIMQKRISRNNRLVIPQYYNREVMYLAPLKIGESLMPLAIEKHQNSYRANTVFTLEMAYSNARLIMKPESNWLTNMKRTSSSTLWPTQDV